MRKIDIRGILKVENITERYRKARLEWFGHVRRRKKDSGDGTTWEKKKRKSEGEMDGLCQPRHESYRDNKR